MAQSKQKSALAVGIAVLLIVAILAWINPLQTVQWKISDLFFRGRGASDMITVISIDEKSLDPVVGLGRFKDWPRSYYSQLIRAIGPRKPAVIAFDLDFRDASRGISALRLQQVLREYERVSGDGGNLNWPSLLKKFEDPKEHPDDVDFQKAIDESSAPIVLTSSLTFSEELSEASQKFPAVASVVMPIFGGPNLAIGYKNVMRDRDGILRRFMPALSGAGPETDGQDGGLKSFRRLLRRSIKDRLLPKVRVSPTKNKCL